MELEKEPISYKQKMFYLKLTAATVILTSLEFSQKYILLGNIWLFQLLLSRIKPFWWMVGHGQRRGLISLQWLTYPIAKQQQWNLGFCDELQSV